MLSTRILTCICTAFACAAPAWATAPDGGRDVHIKVSMPDGSSAAGTTVSAADVDGTMLQAHLLQENLFVAHHVGQKLILEVAHPDFGNVKLIGQLRLRDDSAAVIFTGPGHAELIVPSNPPGMTGKHAPAGGIAGVSSCCIANGGLGCDDPECQAIVCGVDPFCCDVAWDGICAGEAISLCGDLCTGGGGGNDNCADAIEIFDGNTPYNNFGATNDGPSPCGGLGSDIWFNYTATCDGTVTVNTCLGDTNYDSAIAAYNGCACPVGAPLACNDDFCGLQTQITFPVTAGNCYKIQVGGFVGSQGSGTISITCSGGGGQSNCCVPNGGVCCDDPDCCAIVCAIDPFCCDVSWDSICAGEAADLCGDLCGGGGNPACNAGAGDCCIADGTPGCDDADCCNAVCAIDPFCCDVSWDGICVGEAEAEPLCDQGACAGGGGCDSPCAFECPPGALDEGEPCGSDTNGGCNAVPPAFTDAACGQTWCGTGWATGGTRDTDWYLVNHGGGVISGTVVSQFPAVCFIVDGIGSCAPVVVGNIGCGDACTNIAVASADLPAGQYVVFVAAGDCGGGGVFEGFPCGDCNQYSVSIECVGAVTGACCLPDDSCIDGVTEAECVAPAGGCGNCNQASGVPGCSDPVCQAIVCGIDPFCCDVAWDSICAGEANDLCNCGGGLGGEYQGDDSTCADVQCGVPTGACCQCNGAEQFCTIETDIDCAALGGLFLGDDTSCEAAGEQLTVSSGTVNVPIPDNDPVGASHTIMVGPSFTVVDVDVQLTITHTWVGDLCVTLTHGGTTRELIRRQGLSPDTCGPGSCCGCSADNYSGLALDDEGAGGAIESAACVNNLTSPPAYTPNQSLDAYDGDDSAGAWTLSVYDGAGADIGSIVNWSIILTQPATGTPCEAAFPDQCQPSVPRTLIIKQGACPAPVNPGSNGLTLMLLAGDADFDVSGVDTSTLALSRCDGVGGSVGPATINVKDLNHPNPAPATCETGGCTCNADQSSDGIDDLELKFDTAAMAAALELGEVAVGEIVTLVLSGELTDGTAFTASDCIRIVGAGNSGLIAVTSNLPDVWIDASPVDVNFDDGGFTSFSRAYPDLTEVSFTAPKTPASHPTWVLVSVTINGVKYPANDGNFMVVAAGATQWVFLEYRQRSIGPAPGGPAVVPPGAGNAE